MSEAPFTPTGLDALPPAEVARKAELVGVTKAGMETFNVFVLSILAGLTFSLGLILVVVAGAELFTGNNLIVMGWASRRVSTVLLLENWTIVWVGNFVGAFATAFIVYVSGQYTFGGGAVGQTALSIAAAKTSLGFVEAIALGMLCNALVCLAIWLTYGAHTTTDKILAIIPPIAAFVAAGFEHSVANMYFISIGLLIERDEGFVESLQPPPDLSNLNWASFFLDNLLPVTVGNIIGGAVMVGAVYWLVYLRPRRAE